MGQLVPPPRLSRRSVDQLVQQFRHADGYEAEKMFLDLTDLLRGRAQLRAARDTGLFEVLRARVQQSNVRELMLTARILLAYECEADYHCEIGIDHDFLSLGLTRCLPDAVRAAVAQIEWGKTAHMNKSQMDLANTALDAAVYWLQLLGLLTAQDHVMRTFAAASVVPRTCEGRPHEETKDFFEGLTDMFQLLVQHSVCQSFQQHAALCWQIMWRLLQHEFALEQFCQSSRNMHHLRLALERFSDEARLEEQLYVYGAIGALLTSPHCASQSCYKCALSMAAARCRAADANIFDDEIVGILASVCAAVVALAHGKRIWNDQSVCLAGSAQSIQEYKHAVCGALLVAWMGLLDWARDDIGLKRGLDAWGSCSLGTTVGLLASVAAHAHSFNLLRLALSAVAVAIGFSSDIPPMGNLEVKDAADVVNKIAIRYWSCIEMRHDLCIALNATTTHEPMLKLILISINELESWSLLGADYLMLCGQVLQAQPHDFLTLVARSLLAKLVRVPLAKKDAFPLAGALLAFLARLIAGR